jgi:glycosyltransferase involved in cell wall biosynthesis
VSTDPTVSVVIPVLNGAGGLRTTLAALVAQEGAPDFEVVVVDNGSTDDTAAVAAAHPLVREVVVERTPGPYAARNAGIATARGTVIALTDADCKPVPQWLREGVAAVDAGADLVGGRVIQRSTRDDASVWEIYDRGTYLNQRQFVTEQNFAATANLFVRSRVFDEIGRFRPELTASGDLEFGQRATARGHRLVYCDEAAVMHDPRTTLRDTWHLHRKLGCGFAELARAGLREPMHRDLALRIPVGHVWHQMATGDTPALRFSKLLPVHAFAMTARWVGRVTGRA